MEKSLKKVHVEYVNGYVPDNSTSFRLQGQLAQVSSFPLLPLTIPLPCQNLWVDIIERESNNA